MSTPLPEDRFLDRELSWLSFNERVLDLARDAERIPLIERAMFLSIVSSNLDEFFMVRVAGLQRRLDAGVAKCGSSGIPPRDVLKMILRRTRQMVAEQRAIYADDVHPALIREGVVLLGWDELSDDERTGLAEIFAEKIFPVLTPLGVDPAHPFPYISGLSLNLAVTLRNPSTGRRQFARVKVPPTLPRFLPIGTTRFVAIEDVIAHHLPALFTGMEVLDHVIFRVTRNEDVEVEEDDAENLLTALENELLRRKVGRPPVRLEIESGADEDLRARLIEELDISADEVFDMPSPLDLSGLSALRDVPRDDLKFPAFLPKTHPDLAAVETASPADMFAALSRRDVLLHHPYDSFATSVTRFVEQAAADPAVLAIKQTLYRTSGDSPIVDALIDAARAGKQVLALVEIKARFDEQNNIAWARKLERNGVHVVYGVVGLKTHCKLSLVVRAEGDGLRRYAHIGTGNYHPKTARMYEDMGLMTANPIITEDVAKLFNDLSGMSAERSYRRLLVAPHALRPGLLKLIEAEIDHHRAGRPAGIRIKVNSIVDEDICDALYRASQAGVPVDLWVRGICALRPGVPGLSENIRVRSVLGRFLEHSRLYWFCNGGNPLVGIGSADLMHRNLDRRVETLVLLTQPHHRAQVETLFDLCFAPDTISWQLDGTTGEWRECSRDAEGRLLRDLQAELIQRVEERTRR